MDLLQGVFVPSSRFSAEDSVVVKARTEAVAKVAMHNNAVVYYKGAIACSSSVWMWQ